MPYVLRIGQYAVAVLCGVIVLALSGGALLFATHPAAAEAAIAAVQTVTCAVTGTSACITGSDTSSGIGVLGSSNTGTGVRGMANSNYGVKGSSGTSFGIFGTSSSGLAGIAGTTANNYGVYGYTTGTAGSGVFGLSNAKGVYGSSSTGNGYGVVGSEPNEGTGAYGESGSGFGVEGFANRDGGTALFADAAAGATGLFVGADSGNGIFVTTSGNYAIYATGNNTAGYFSSPKFGLISDVTSTSTAYPLILQSNGSDVLYVDSGGTIHNAGGLQSFSRTASGATVSAFSAKTTAPTVEDTGTAQLVGGAGSVRFDPVFAASIDPRSTYQVFLTPGGDTHGLFIASKTPGGFVVRESEGGHATISFDYRVVATALGQAGKRMAVTTIAAFHAALPPAPKEPIARRPPVTPPR